MSATLRRRCVDIPGAGSRCKGNQLFWIEQEKSDFFAFFDSADYRRAQDRCGYNRNTCG